jgi:hypothetical protein
MNYVEIVRNAWGRNLRISFVFTRIYKGKFRFHNRRIDWMNLNGCHKCRETDQEIWRQ